MDQQPKIPTLKDAQKPQVKIKGMGAGLTLFDRLKQFKKKDLAFILAGLGTLFMAPLAEHFMMAPEGGDASLQQGWGKGGNAGNGLFGSGSSPYENGNNSIASGGAIGGAGDIITPLNVRDPSALVMGPGAAQQPPAGSIAPATPAAPSRSETDYKDALAGAASRAASAAVKRAPLPIPKVGLSGSSLRGLGVAGGGSSAGSSLGPINSGAGGTAGTGGGGLNLVRSAPNFRGVAGARGPNSPQGLDGTKKAGENAGDAFSRSGSALGGLNAAASEQIPTGGQGFGGGGQGGVGANDKPGGGSGPGGSKSVGESLAFLEQKQRQEERLKLEFEKAKLKDNELLMYGIRNDVLKASAGEVGKGLTTWGMCKGLGMGCPPADVEYKCTDSADTPSFSPACDDKKTTGCWTGKSGSYYYTPIPGGVDRPNVCTPTGKPKDAAGSKTQQAATDGPVGMSSSAGLSDVCGKIPAKVSAPPKDAAPAAAGTAVVVDDANQVALNKYFTDTLGPKAKETEFAQNQLVGGGSTKCGSTPPKKTVTQLLGEAKANLLAAGESSSAADAVSLIVAGADKVEVPKADEARKARDAAVANIETAKTQIALAERTLNQTYPVERPKGLRVSDEADVTNEETKITTAEGEAKKLIETLKNDNIKELEKGITSLEPLVGKAAPDGALSDQIKLNKALAGLTAAAKDKTEYKPEIDAQTAEAVKAQAPARASAGDLKKAVNNAYTTAETAKAATGDAKKKADAEAAEALKLVEPAVTKAKTDVEAAQKELKDVAGEAGKKIGDIKIGGATAAPVTAAK